MPNTVVGCKAPTKKQGGLKAGGGSRLSLGSVLFLGCLGCPSPLWSVGICDITQGSLKPTKKVSARGAVSTRRLACAAVLGLVSRTRLHQIISGDLVHRIHGAEQRNPLRVGTGLHYRVQDDGEGKC